MPIIIDSTKPDDGITEPNKNQEPRETSWQGRELTHMPRATALGSSHEILAKKPSLSGTSATLASIQMARLQKTLGIVSLDDLKGEFLCECLQSILPLDLVRFDRKTPLFHSGMEQLKANYEKWDSIQDPIEIESLKHKIQIQHANLAKLAKLLKEVAPEKEQLLTQLTLSDDFPFDFSGVEIFDELALRDALTTLIDKVQAEFPELLAPASRKLPISAKAIELQAKVFKAEREFKDWAAQQAELKPLGTSVNFVIEMKVPGESKENDQSVAYYKQEKTGESTSAVMEKMMWDIAVILGIEEQFVPTKLTVVSTATPTEATRGSLQPTQTGTSLLDVIDGVAKINRPSLIRGMLTTIVLGMFDAHADNIRVSPEGNVKFFDNSRSMPHTTEFLDRGGDIYAPYRCALLAVPGCEQPLSKSELEQLQTELATIESKMNALEKFLNSPQTKKQIAQLPPGWMNSREALVAMKARIDGLKEALVNSEQTSLRDLALNANPIVKLNTALHFIKEMHEDTSKDGAKIRELLTYALGNSGSVSLGDLLDACLSAGIDPKYIQDLCSDAYSFDEIVESILIDMEEVAGDPGRINNAHYRKNAEKMMEAFWREAKVDYKDIKSKYIAETIYLSMLANVCSALSKNFSEEIVSKSWEETKIKFFPEGKYDLYFTDSKQTLPTLNLVKRKKGGEPEHLMLDYSSVPGKFIIKEKGRDLPPMTAGELKQLLKLERLSQLES